MWVKIDFGSSIRYLREENIYAVDLDTVTGDMRLTTNNSNDDVADGTAITVLPDTASLIADIAAEKQ